MRIIKFRAIAISSGEFVYGNFIHSKRFAGHANEFRIHDSDIGVERNIDVSTLGQFTGLTDKNGVEIYEGDVIGREGFFNRVLISDGIIFQTYSMNNIERMYLFTKNSIDEFDKIIGNIHQNKDLL